MIEIKKTEALRGIENVPPHFWDWIIYTVQDASVDSSACNERADYSGNVLSIALMYAKWISRFRPT